LHVRITFNLFLDIFNIHIDIRILNLGDWETIWILGDSETVWDLGDWETIWILGDSETIWFLGDWETNWILGDWETIGQKLRRIELGGYKYR
jgi:hypothetical protein